MELPKAIAGDILIIHDTGAYSMATYSRFNSILPSMVFGYSKKDDGSLEFRCFKERESYEENLVFWGAPEGQMNIH